MSSDGVDEGALGLFDGASDASNEGGKEGVFDLLDGACDATNDGAEESSLNLFDGDSVVSKRVNKGVLEDSTVGMELGEKDSVLLEGALDGDSSSGCSGGGDTGVTPGRSLGYAS